MRTTMDAPKSHRRQPRRWGFGRSEERKARVQFPAADVTALLQQTFKLPGGMIVMMTGRTRESMTLVVQHASYGQKPLGVLTMQLSLAQGDVWEEVWSLQLTRPRLYEIQEVIGGLRGCFDIVKNHYGLWWY